jgi:hypothetical protein
VSPNDSTHVLRAGLARILETWRARFDGERDLLQGVLREQLADLGEAPAGQPPLEVRRAHDAIRGYFDNVRYTLLSPTARIWGTLTNALRVAAGVESVTPTQRTAFGFTAASLAGFFRAAQHDLALAGSLREVFRPMPAADCQTLAALFELHGPIDGATVVAVTRVLGNEGPLTSEEAGALATLRSTGLIGVAFAGIRGDG